MQELRTYFVGSMPITCRVTSVEGPAIVFLHGNSLSMETFENQFSDPELGKLNLIAVDFPGHGATKPASDPERQYTLFYFRDLVVDLLEQIEIGRFIFAGHSLGGHVAMECLPFAPNCMGLALWGAPPVRLPLDVTAIFKPHPASSLLFKSDLNANEIRDLSGLVAARENAAEIARQIRASDPLFRQFFTQSLAKGILSDEYLLLKESGLPVSIFHGVGDELVNEEYYRKLDLPELWRGQPVLIDESSHIPHLENPAVFNALLFNFYREVM